ncbi:uncharacterized protein LOC143292308 [Babylonia areolata]|uniref:uncharacterized protein LOC143292308 n=1 Tax=Babylonia areolata TaxID=304850 RepID=UPI003FCF054E
MAYSGLQLLTNGKGKQKTAWRLVQHEREQEENGLYNTKTRSKFRCLYLDNPEYKLFYDLSPTHTPLSPFPQHTILPAQAHIRERCCCVWTNQTGSLPVPPTNSWKLVVCCLLAADSGLGHCLERSTHQTTPRVHLARHSIAQGPVTMTQYSTMQKLSLAGMVIGFLLCLVGACAPYWIISDPSGFGEIVDLGAKAVKGSLGLFMYCVEVLGDSKCEVFDMDNDSGWFHSSRVAACGCVLVGAVCAGISLCLACCSCCKRFIVVGILAFVSAVAGAYCIAVFSKNTETFTESILDFKVSSYGWAYYMFIGGVGTVGVVSFMACFSAPENPLRGVVLSRPGGGPQVVVSSSTTTNTHHPYSPLPEHGGPVMNTTHTGVTVVSNNGYFVSLLSPSQHIVPVHCPNTAKSQHIVPVHCPNTAKSQHIVPVHCPNTAKSQHIVPVHCPNTAKSQHIVPVHCPNTAKSQRIVPVHCPNTAKSQHIVPVHCPNTAKSQHIVPMGNIRSELKNIKLKPPAVNASTQYGNIEVVKERRNTIAVTVTTSECGDPASATTDLQSLAVQPVSAVVTPKQELQSHDQKSGPKTVENSGFSVFTFKSSATDGQSDDSSTTTLKTSDPRLASSDLVPPAALCDNTTEDSSSDHPTTAYSVPVDNFFAPLSDSALSDKTAEIPEPTESPKPDKETCTVSRERSQKRSPLEVLSNISVNENATALLIGDSIIKHEDPMKLGLRSYTLHKICVPGMATHDLECWWTHQPAYRNIKALVIHVGVNDCPLGLVFTERWTTRQDVICQVTDNKLVMLAAQGFPTKVSGGDERPSRTNTRAVHTNRQPYNADRHMQHNAHAVSVIYTNRTVVYYRNPNNANTYSSDPRYSFDPQYSADDATGWQQRSHAAPHAHNATERVTQTQGRSYTRGSNTFPQRRPDNGHRPGPLKMTAQYSTIQKLSLAGMVIGSILILVGAGAPYWIVSDPHGFGEIADLVGRAVKGSLGLFMYCVEVLGHSECQTIDMDNDSGWFHSARVGAAVCVLVSCVCGAISLCLACCSCCKRFIVLGILDFLAAVAGAYSIAVFSNNTGTFTESILDFKVSSYGWAYYMFIGGVGTVGVVSFMACFSAPENPLRGMVLSRPGGGPQVVVSSSTTTNTHHPYMHLQEQGPPPPVAMNATHSSATVVTNGY